MKKTIYLIMICICFFICNILLYNFNRDYKVFVKNLKYNNENQIITDDQVTPIKDISGDITVNNLPLSTKDLVSDLIEEKTNKAPEENSTSGEKTEIKKEKSLVEKNIEIVLNIFNGYNLSKNNDINLFGLIFEGDTTPVFGFDKYVHSEFEIYLFKNGTFEEIQIAYELNKNTSSPKFIINQTNSFGKKSFFINTIEDDGKARLIIETNNIVIGLKINKSYYNEIKNTLVKL